MKYINWSFFVFYSDELENKCDDFDDILSFKYFYKDNDEEFIFVERIYIIRIEKIITNRRIRFVGKKFDLGVFFSLGKDKFDIMVINFR